jgi:hypothetical protein
MIKEIMLSDLQEIQRRKENLSVCALIKKKQKYFGYLNYWQSIMKFMKLALIFRSTN